MHKSSRAGDAHGLERQIAAQDGRFKCIVSSYGWRELYNLQTDPGELHNLAEILPDVTRRFADYIEQWREAVAPYVPK